MRGRRGFLVGLGALGFGGAAEAQGLSDLFGGILNKNKGATAAVLGGGLSQADAATGLKEALRLGATAATNRLGLLDGFFADGKVHIPLPGTLVGVQRNLKPLGLSAPLDDVELKMNRAAEASMPVAKTLFINAINAITLNDALSILRGGDTAATDFLRGKTTPDLTKLLRPQMDKMLASTGAFTPCVRSKVSPPSVLCSTLTLG